ncbi:MULTISPECIES: DUF1302 family protein [unclassified Pseudomonas]|uniref:DUF1302 family protein n=1 Tax=unclassified Pseudomonas TaxID=196821 RepID=UPI001CC169EF|nr:MULTISPECIES: DUF1302 family protein [unclassified Pseudomonas]
MLDYYAYGTWDVSGHALNARLGNQVVSWGESLLYPGFPRPRAHWPTATTSRSASRTGSDSPVGGAQHVQIHPNLIEHGIDRGSARQWPGLRQGQPRGSRPPGPGPDPDRRRKGRQR